MSSLQQVDRHTFEQMVLRCEMPVLVDFWATWCGPCRLMMPTVEEVADLYDSELRTVAFNVTTDADAMERFNARSIPLFVVFEGGREKARAFGAMSKTRLCAFLDANL